MDFAKSQLTLLSHLFVTQILSRERAQIQDSQTILDLGYGQGPFTSHVALKHKNCRSTAVTDLISQKGFIKEQCKYPQVEQYLKNKRMHNVVDLLNDSKGNERKKSIELDIEGFKSALSHVDLQMKNLPATAQVAAQQGAYLARCFNHMKDSEDNPEGPLRFRESGRHQFQPFR